MDPGLHRPLLHAYGRKERAGLRGASSFGSANTEAKHGEVLDTHGYTRARIKDLPVIGHIDAIAMAPEMVYTMTRLIGLIPKPQSRARTRYPIVLEPVQDAKSFPKKPVEVLQDYDASAINTLNKALSDLHSKILPESPGQNGGKRW